MMHVQHFAVCYQTPHGRCGVVETFPKFRQEYKSFPANTNRIGYVGCDSFEEAIIRVGKMERNEPNAWGVL